MADAVEPAPNNSSLRLTDAISLGVLAEVIGRDLIEDVLDEAGRREQRTRRLPAHVMVRFCLAMCLFYDDDYEEVMRKLAGSLKEMDSWRDDWQVPTTSAIAQARQRLNEEPLRILFERIAAPVAGRGTKGAWLGSRRLMAIDGFMLDVPDTVDNVEEFGRLDTGPKASAFPQVRILALNECGSHASVAASFGPCRDDERALLTGIIGAFTQDMLVIADREGNGTGELVCLITSILDPAEVTAIELATAYHERWESETSFREKKTYLRRSGRVLRSKSPKMVRQEIWAMLLTHYAIRKLMCRAADEAGHDPDRLSFTRSLRVIRRQVTDQADFSP